VQVAVASPSCEILDPDPRPRRRFGPEQPLEDAHSASSIDDDPLDGVKTAMAGGTRNLTGTRLVPVPVATKRCRLPSGDSSRHLRKHVGIM